MSRISKVFKELREKKEGALVGYLTLGDPDPQSSKNLLRCLAENADIIEIGIPFSDPIADGPTIQAAMDRALKGNVNPATAFEFVKELREEGVQTPFVFMTYYNIVLQFGEEEFFGLCEEAGVDGLLVSDLSLEESEGIVKGCERHGIDPIFLIAPTTPDSRVKKIISRGKGFLYLVSLLGVTGSRERVEDRTLLSIKKTLEISGSSLPLVVGFGISKKSHVRKIVGAGAQGVVVGSAFVKLVEKHGGEACRELERFSKELKEGTKPDAST